jgi:hypothetical protein
MEFSAITTAIAITLCPRVRAIYYLNKNNKKMGPATRED